MKASRVVVCPDKLKGVLSAAEAADAVARGIEREGGAAVCVPLADGGEGTADAIASTRGGTWLAAEVDDALGRPTRARFLLLDDGRAVVDSAEAVGLWRLREDERDPLRATSRGLGTLIAAAAQAGAREVLVGLGGSATVDGGAGLRETLPALPVPVTIVCDVTSPLHGPHGAARVYGPQKGASPEAVEELERRLRAMAELEPYGETPGAGAAGGLGAALLALGAELRPGFDVVAEEVGLAERLRGARLVVTGEGAVDRSSLAGKATSGVVGLCASLAVPCVVFGGRVDRDAAHALLDLGAAAVLPLSGRPEQAAEDLELLGRGLARLAATLA